MKTVLISTLLAAALLPAVANAATPPIAASAPQAAWAEAEVRKVDAATGKLTLKHGPIASLDMPPMTMVFGLAAGAKLDGLKAGDRVQFQAAQQGGAYVVTALRKAQP